MVKKLIRLLSYTLFFLLALMYFMPKQNLYYFVENLLVPHAIILSSEEVVDKGFTLDVNHATLSLKSIESATIEQIHFKMFALYNAISFENITLSSAIKSLVPQHVAMAEISYTLFDPFFINASLSGEFGEAQARLQIFEKTVHIELVPSDKMLKEYKTTLQNMSKTESGEYIYDKNVSF